MDSENSYTFDLSAIMDDPSMDDGSEWPRVVDDSSCPTGYLGLYVSSFVDS